MVYAQCAAVVQQLEDRQVREGKGMTVAGSEADRDEIDRALKAKLGFQTPGS
jgi:ABC-type lipopolysaccharide export system ATPase subunit